MEKTKKAYVAASPQAQFLILLRIHMPAYASEDTCSATGCASTVPTFSPKYSEQEPMPTPAQTPTRVDLIDVDTSDNLIQTASSEKSEVERNIGIQFVGSTDANKSDQEKRENLVKHQATLQYVSKRQKAAAESKVRLTKCTMDH